MSRSDLIRMALTPKRIALLTTLREFDGGPTSVVLERDSPGAKSDSYIQSAIKALEDEGLIHRWRMPAPQNRGSGESWLQLTAKGRRLLQELGASAEELAALSATPPYFTWLHDRLVRQIRIRLQRGCENHPLVDHLDWTNEHELRRDPIQIADPLNRDAPPLKAVPDAIFTLTRTDGTRKRFYLEVDCDTIGPLKLRQRLRAYLTWLPIHAKGSPVIWTVPSPKRRDEIAALTMQEAARLSASPRLVWLTLVDQITDATVLDEPIWSSVGGPTVALFSSATPQVG